jgi:ATP-dependent Lon protease
MRTFPFSDDSAEVGVDESAPAGFVSRNLQTFQRDQIVMTQLLIPRSRDLSAFLDKRDKLARKKLDSLERRRRQKALQSWDERQKKTAKESDERQRKKRQEAAKLTPEAERQELAQIRDSQLTELAMAEEQGSPPSMVQVYDWDEPLKLIKDLGYSIADKELAFRCRELFKKLKQKGHLRKIARPAGSVKDAMDKLRNSHPHFSLVIDLVQERLAFAEVHGRSPSVPPILLIGPPGVGKTDFSQRLAAALDAPIRRHGFDTAVTESAFLGTDKRWANTTYGNVFELLCLGEAANPVFLLDEIDKAAANDKCDPVASLHTLLEPVTATRVRDISVELEFDASHVTWIATANDVRKVPSSLRSRFNEFEIKHPAAEQALRIAMSVASAVHQKVGGVQAFQIPSRRIAVLVAHLTAREQMQALEAAFARASVNGRTELRRGDLPADVLIDDIEEEGGHRGRPPGSLH